MIMCKYETTNLNSLRAIISRVGIGEASLSNISLPPVLSLESHFIFFWRIHTPCPLARRFPDRYRLFFKTRGNFSDLPL